MKIVFSRKGFDSGSTSGGAPSPIIDDVPYSLPIPSGKYPSGTTYQDLELGEMLAKIRTKSKAGDRCHEDPMFWGDRCAFGQTSTSQSHLENNKVREGDVFLFFGLFAEGRRDPHHRIFGYLKVEQVLPIGSQPSGQELGRTPRRHPHTIAKWDTDRQWGKNNTIYLGQGKKAKKAHAGLRLSRPDGPTSRWIVPEWLRKDELTYHQQPWRWHEDGTLHVVSRGQEFVADIGDRPEPKNWLEERIALVETD
jgi:hypothetical protein